MGKTLTGKSYTFSSKFGKGLATIFNFDENHLMQYQALEISMRTKNRVPVLSSIIARAIDLQIQKTVKTQF